MDRLSGLPDEIIQLIVRFLSAKEAPRVSVLSKRFRNLFTTLPDLHLNADEIQGMFTDHVCRVLALLETNTRIRKISIKCRRGLDTDHINDWLRDVLKRGVMDLELSIYGDSGYELPLEIFTCDTLVKLKLGSEFVISDIPNNASLPSLETLVLESVKFDSLGDCAFEALLLACPVLKELEIDGMYWESWNWSRNVSSRTLERLTIGRELSDEFHGPDFQSISFDTPSLTYLAYTDFVPDAYPIVNFESLVEAKLFLQVLVNHQWNIMLPDDDYVFSSNPTNLIQGMRNVKILELSSPLSFETFYFFREAIPVFQNLRQLTITNNDMGFCWRFFPFLLNKTPKLKTLIIEGVLHYVEEHDDDVQEDDDVKEDDDVEEHDYVCECLSGYSCLLSCPVEILHITLGDNGTPGELEQVKHFLGKLSYLRLLKVGIWERISDREKLRIAKDLLMFPRASSECKIAYR